MRYINSRFTYLLTYEPDSPLRASNVGNALFSVSWRPLANTFVEASGDMPTTAELVKRGQPHDIAYAILQSSARWLFIVDRFPRAHPRHQPELDTAYMKAKCNSWETSNEATYVDPRLQRNPALLANTDVATDDDMDSANVTNNASSLDCFNCNVRPRDRVHPSLVDDQPQQQTVSQSP